MPKRTLEEAQHDDVNNVSRIGEDKNEEIKPNTDALNLSCPNKRKKTILKNGETNLQEEKDIVDSNDNDHNNANIITKKKKRKKRRRRRY